MRRVVVIALTRGVAVGPSRAEPSRQLPSSCFAFETVTYGGSADLWDEAWTPADVNAAGFGVGMAFNGDDTHVDGVDLTVAYCP